MFDLAASIAARFSRSLLSISGKAAALVLLSMVIASAAHAAAVYTTTELTVATPSVPQGTPTLLVATVTDALSKPVLAGTITFYDGKRVLGAAQIVRQPGGSFAQGTASLKTASFSLGANSVTAVFGGTTADLSSTSAAKMVTATGINQTSVVLTGSGSGEGSTLTADLQALGVGVPTGSVTLRDTLAAVTRGTVPSSGVMWASNFLFASSSVGGGDASIEVGDFNGDGFPDVATLSYIVLGSGDGTFQAPRVDSSGTGFPADFNNDGKLDFLQENSETGEIGVQLGSGDGSFQSPISTVSAPFLSSGLAVSDFDRDGNLDVVVTASNQSDVYVMLGNGDGTFRPPAKYATPSTPNYVVAGDLNGDGYPDLVMNGELSDSIWVLLNNGKGGFGMPSVYFIGYGVGSSQNIVLADLNSDGKLDLAVSNDLSVMVALGKGDGSFEVPTNYPIGSVAGQLVIADFNADGKLDIAALAELGIDVLEGNGEGGFQPTVAYDLYTSLNWISTADFNGDGRPDIVGGGGSVYLGAQIANVQLGGVALPEPGASLLQASYSGDAAFAPSISNVLGLTPYDVDLSGGFVPSSTLQGNGSASIVANYLQLTDGGQSEASSMFYTIPVNVDSFTTDFTFNAGGEGITFVIQGVGPTALGANARDLGYGGIPNSVAIKFDTYNNVGEGNDSTGIYFGGQTPTLPSIDLTKTGINLQGDPCHAHLTYDGANLVLTIDDLYNLASWSHTFPVTIPYHVGGNAAYVGFTAATGGLRSPPQSVYGWTYVTGPPVPGSNSFVTSGVQLNGSSAVVGPAIRLTDGGLNEAGSAFTSSEQYIESFNNDFDLQLLNPLGDGLTFAIQGVSPNALGAAAANLGYGGIPNSVAIKFQTGSGSDSTGIYFGGQAPTSPSIDLTGTGINLHSGDPFHVHMTYNGATLTMTITDTVTQVSWTHAFTVTIPFHVGGNNAYVGFTGATGGVGSTQTITSWSLVPGAP